MLEQWLAAAVEAAGVEVDPSLVSDEAVTAILDLARDAAHNVERPAAPLAAFAAGLALGRSSGDSGQLQAVAGRIASRAESFIEDEGA